VVGFGVLGYEVWVWVLGEWAKGRKGDGAMERWRDGEMERWSDGEMERWRDLGFGI